MSETPDTTAAPKAAAAIPADSDILLKADSLIAGYLPGINILNGCNLYVAPDELIGIIGPNGAGKSTLLKSLFGLVKVHEGSVTLRGENITNLKADQLVTKGVGFVPQTNNVFPSLTVEENLEMGVFQAPKRYSERIDFVVDLFPMLGKRRKQRAGSLSGGERQMVAMGRALMMDQRAAPGRAVGGPVPRPAGRGVHPDPADQQGRGRGGHGGAERPPLPADL